MRLQERSLDARALLWISLVCFLLGYLVWEALDGSSPSRPSNRSFINCNRPGSHAERNLIRFESSEIVLVGFSRPHGLGPRPEDFDRSHFVRFHLGTVGVSVPSEHIAGGL